MFGIIITIVVHSRCRRGPHNNITQKPASLSDENGAVLVRINPKCLQKVAMDFFLLI